MKIRFFFKAKILATISIMVAAGLELAPRIIAAPNAPDSNSETAVLAARADGVHLFVDTEQVLNNVHQNIYGQFIEHIYHSADGGLWGDLIWNRSFEGSGVPSWRVENDVLMQEGTRCDSRLSFGESGWTDFDFSVNTRSINDQGALYIFLRDQGRKEFVLGNQGKERGARDVFRMSIKTGASQEILLERLRTTDKRSKFEKVSAHECHGIKPGEWHDVRVRCQGTHMEAWLDGERVIDYTDDGSGSHSGRLGIGTSDAQAQFRHFAVNSLDGKKLFSGVPPLEPVSDPAPMWHVYGAGRVTISSEKPFNGQRCACIKTDGPETGLIQSPLSVRTGENYKGSIWMRGNAATGVTIRLLDGSNVLAETKFSKIGAEWKEYGFELKPHASSDHASISITTAGEANISLDQVSMMPESWSKQGGFRPDLLKAVSDLQPSIIRWPGGFYAERYRWKDGIGPQSKRQPYSLALWDDVDVNSFGTDEFVAMCRKVKAEPVIAINTGRYDDKTPRSVYLQEACEWLEYCNGPSDSPWGSLRAKNGHPEPYGIKYWEIDNEVWLVGLDNYVKIVDDFTAALKKVDPSIQIILCGGGGLDNKWRENWNPRLMAACGDKGEYLSIHKYESAKMFATGSYTFEAHFKELEQMIANSTNPEMKVFVSEWGAMSIDWQSGLYAGSLLNGFERHGNTIQMACPALFLRHSSARDWNNAFINFNSSSWFAGANYVVMKLWREHYLPLRVSLKNDTGVINAVATKSADGNVVIVKMVNPASMEVPVQITLPIAFESNSAVMQKIDPGSVTARNTFKSPNEIHSMPGEVKTDGANLSITLPPFSVAALKVTKK